jgi:hypothetical protein
MWRNEVAIYVIVLLQAVANEVAIYTVMLLHDVAE